MALSAAGRATVILIATVLGVALTANLGAWQLRRASQKIALQDALDSRATLSALGAADLAHTAAQAEPQHYRPVHLRGRWVPERNVFLENRQMKERVGFYLVTPLQLEGRSDAVLVQRGWVPRDLRDRTLLPRVETPAGTVEVDGHIAPPPARLYEFAPSRSGLIRQNLDLGEFTTETGLQLAPLSVLQSDSASTAGDGLLRQWPRPAVDVQKHYGYAFQWFALCALMAGCMSGSNSSGPGSSAASATSEISAHDSPVGLTVHSMRPPELDDDAARRTKNGRMKMLLVLAVCAAPVIASYLTYFVIRPEGRTNYSELIQPQRPIPPDLPLTDLQGKPVKSAWLKDQWLLVVVSGAACDATCERLLWVQRQLRETLGREKDRVDKVWLIDDEATPKPQALEGVTVNTEATVLRVPAKALAAWLQPAAGHPLEAHMYIVDPLGNWMMRAPADPDPAKLKRDVEKLLRASAGWDKPGR